MRHWYGADALHIVTRAEAALYTRLADSYSRRMQKVAALLVFASLACASGDGFVSEGVKQCRPGDPIEINAGFEASGSPGQDLLEDRLTLLVEIANNSDEDLTVETVRADPQTSPAGTPRYELVGGSITPRQLIAEADAFLFRVPMSVRLANEQAPRGASVPAEVAVSVALADGTRYRCRFQVSR